MWLFVIEKRVDMGFLTGMIGAVVKTALTPIAILEDVVSVTQGEVPGATVDVVSEVVGDVIVSVGDLAEGDLI